jgi:hypothetical protein
MSPSDDADFYVGHVRNWVLLERQRAERAAVMARRHEEKLALASEAMRPHHQRLATLYRRIEQRHLASGQMQAMHAGRLRRWAEAGASQGVIRPLFMASVATILDVDSATLALFGRWQLPAMVAASNATARAAHDLEFTLGEGPMIDAVEQRHVVFVAGPAILDRWPEYGAAVAELGVRAVVAMPVQLPTVNLGALCGFDSRPELYGGVTASADRVADALAHAVLQAAQLPEHSHITAPHLPLFDEADYCEVVHQAVGMVAVQCDCDLRDAMAILRARAFADGHPSDVIAERIVRGTLRLS